MQDPKRLQALLTEAAPGELESAFRPMFGGIMGYAAGKAFASLSNVGLALKLAGADREALLAVPGSAPLRPWIVRSAAALASAHTRTG